LQIIQFCTYSEFRIMSKAYEPIDSDIVHCLNQSFASV
jgi:hypothetical protein